MGLRCIHGLFGLTENVKGTSVYRAKGHRTLGSARSHAVGAAVLAPEQEISAAPKISPAIGSAKKACSPSTGQSSGTHWPHVEDLDVKVPHPAELLSQRLELWCDGQWRCFQDKRPHRLALLSEGRVESSDGTLMCSYHGWRFDGEGKCTDIPQSLDAKANASACANPHSCAISHQTQADSQQ